MNSDSDKFFQAKKAIGLSLFIAIAVSSAGCDFIYRLLHKEGAEEKELVGEFVPFEKNLVVEEIQILLKIYGYSPGPADGVLGLRTRDAIEKFQEDHHLEPTRVADQQTWQKLKVFRDNNMIVEGKLNVSLIQQCLEAAGMNPGKIDGKFGPKTKQAVKKFQEAHDLKVDGKVGYRTLSKLALFLPPPAENSP